MKMMTSYEEYLNMELNLTFEGMRLCVQSVWILTEKKNRSVIQAEHS